jgi:hypothetical protein
VPQRLDRIHVRRAPEIVKATGIHGSSWMFDCAEVLRQEVLMEFVAEEFRQAWGNDGSASSGGAWWADFR